MTLLNTHTRGFASLINRDLGSLLSAAPATAATTYIPPVDVREEDDRFVIEADLPGLAPTDIEITADKGVLTLRGERKAWLKGPELERLLQRDAEAAAARVAAVDKSARRNALMLRLNMFGAGDADKRTRIGEQLVKMVK